MPQPIETIRLIRVFVSSPGDVTAERESLDEAIANVNDVMGRQRGVRLEAWKWEDDVIPQIGPSPQAVVDAQTPTYGIYLGIMSSRFGTPAEGYGSGTEKEFRDALDRWGEQGSPWILLYFNDNPKVSKKPQDAKQYLQVCEFREELETRGIVKAYSSVRGEKTSFFDLVSKHLNMLVSRLTEQSQPSPKLSRPASHRKPTIPSTYLDWLQKRCVDVDLLGLELKQGQAVQLNHVYVPLATSATKESKLVAKEERSDELTRYGSREDKPQLLLDLLNEKSLYVSGPPGSGKSTFCRWVAWLACSHKMPQQEVEAPAEYRERFPDTFRDRLPLLVRLRDFWRHLPKTPGQQDLATTELEALLVDWIEAQQPGGIRGADVQAFLRQGSALLILDGVDEVPLTRGEERQFSYPRAMLMSGLSAAAETWVERGHRLLVTSRPYGLTETDLRRLGLPHAPINELSEPMQELLVRRWFQILAPDRQTGTETADELLGEIRTREELEPLIANPMLMTAICVIYSQGKRLPQDKYELYDRIVDNVLYNRYRDPALIDLERSRLSILAYGMHTGHGLGEEWTTPHAEVTETEIDRILQAYKEHSPWTEQGYRSVIATREQLLSRTGILLPRGDHRAAFYHFTFQDFLAAQWLQDVAGDCLPDVFRERAPFDEWHNTLSFVFSALLARSTSPNRSIRLLGQLIEAIDDDTLGLAVVAAECLSILMGRKYRMKPDLEQRFREICLSAIEREVPIQARCTLGQALGRLGDPRAGVGLRADGLPDINWVSIPKGRIELEEAEGIFEVEAFLIARYPITWAQYRSFVEDPDGYANSDWWDRLNREDKPGRQYFRFDNGPADNVSWYDAMAFCRWLTARFHVKGLIPDDRIVRLPTEWEWQQAATGGDPERIYPWGPEWTEGLANTYESGLSRTTAVGMYSKGTWPDGPLDMAGNVREWCINKYDTPREATPDTSNDWRVVRGGSWFFYQGRARTDYRYYGGPVYRVDDDGFRVCCASPID